MHPQLENFLITSGEKGFKTNITTNGTLINKIQDILLDKPSLRQLNFSLHSLDGNVNLMNKQEYIYSILSFIKEAMVQSNVLISLRLWNLEENNEANLKNNKNNELLSIIEKEFNLNYKIVEKVVPGRGIKIADRVYLNQDKRFKWPDLNETQESYLGFCYGLRNQIAILVDGTVVPCCLDGEGIINLGNINKTLFSEIINSERANNIVEGFSKREAVEELCRKCGYRSRFGGKSEIII